MARPPKMVAYCLALVLGLLFEATAVAATTTASLGTTATATTTSTTAAATVYNSTTATGVASVVNRYTYQGCYFEMTGTNNTAAGSRSIENGGDEILPGNMTVPICLNFCGMTNSGAAYTYAGLEYGRECWCGQDLSVLAVPEPASDCSLSCDGDTSMLCGGYLRLSLYMINSTSSTSDAVPRAAAGVLWTALAVAVGAIGMHLV